MSDVLFPALIGETYPLIRELIGGNTIVQTTANGLEVRIPLWVDRKFRYTLPYDWLSSEDGIDTYQLLFGFLSVLDGMFDTFLYKDPRDFQAVDQIIGVGDGVTTVFQMQRTLNGATDKVFGIEMDDPVPSIAGAGGYTLSKSGVLTCSGPPAPGAEIIGTFNYYWRVRLDAENLEFEEFAQDYWNVKALKFITCRA